MKTATKDVAASVRARLLRPASGVKWEQHVRLAQGRGSEFAFSSMIAFSIGSLARLKAVLDVQWRYRVHHSAEVFAADGDECFFTARGTRLVSIAIQTGEERWCARVQNPWGCLAVGGESVFYLNQHSLLVALNRATGKPRWTRNVPGINGWLHACGDRLIIGGWRGYTDVLALDARDGEILWRRPARGRELHSTRIHAASRSLVVADPDNGGQVLFLDLDTGAELRRIAAPGSWRETFVERPNGSGHPDVAVLLKQGEKGLSVVRWSQPRPTTAVPDRSIWSENVDCARNVVPFLTLDGELVVWSIEDGSETELGRLEHNRADLLPFVALNDGTFIVGSSFGWIHAIRGRDRTSLRVGKRVSTALAVSGPVIAFGSGSGEIVGLRCGGLP